MSLIARICSCLSSLRHPSDLFTKELKNIIVVSSVGLAQGLISSCDVAYSYIYKDDYSLSPAGSSFLDASNQIPWIIKPVWGALSDNFKLFGYRRKSYLAVMGLLCWICVLNMGSWVPPLFLAFVFLFFSNLGVSFQNCMAEAVLVQNAQEVSRKNNTTEYGKIKAASKGVSIYFATKYLGKVIGSLLIMSLLVDESYRWKYILGASFVPLIVAFIALLLPEARKTDKKLMEKPSINIEMQAGVVQTDSTEPSSMTVMESADTIDSSEVVSNEYTQNNVRKAIQFLKNPVIYKPLILIFFTSFIPQAPQVKFYYYTSYLGFESSFMGSLKFITYSAILLAIIIYNKFLRNVNFRKFFTTTATIGCILTLSQLILIFRLNKYLGIPDKLFAALDTFILELVLEFNTLPVLVLACRICPKDIEATIFAVLMAVSNAGYIISLQFGAFLAYILGITSDNFNNIWIMTMITAIFHLIPLALLYKIKFENAIEHVEGKGSAPEKDSTRIDEPVENSVDQTAPEQKDNEKDKEQSLEHSVMVYSEFVAGEK